MGAAQLIRLPLSILPTDSSEQSLCLRQWIPDKRIRSVTQENGEWLIELTWPSLSELNKDPLLPASIESVFRDIMPDEVATARKNIGEVHVCLNDSWTLLEWSKCLTEETSARGIVIVHLDSHSDLMSPMLSCHGSDLRDLFTGADFDINIPWSVEAAIASGAVGIGSFIVPYLHQSKCEMLIHICPPTYLPHLRGWGSLENCSASTLPYPGLLRPSVRRIEGESRDGHCRHIVTETLDGLGVELRGKIVLLHVDLDFFNNRINGDSHWHEIENPHNPSIDIMISEVGRVFRELRTCGMETPHNVVVACSPEFCPAEYWKPLLDAIQDSLIIDSP